MIIPRGFQRDPITKSGFESVSGHEFWLKTFFFVAMSQ